MPQAIVDRLGAEVQRILHSPETSKQLIGMGATPIGNQPAEFSQFILAERQKWADVIRAANVSVE